MIAWNNCCAGIDESTSGSVDRSGDEEMKKTEFTVSEVSHTSAPVVVVVQVYVMVPRGQALDASPLSGHERVPVPKSGTKSTTTVMKGRQWELYKCIHMNKIWQVYRDFSTPGPGNATALRMTSWPIISKSPTNFVLAPECQVTVLDASVIEHKGALFGGSSTYQDYEYIN